MVGPIPVPTLRQNMPQGFRVNVAPLAPAGGGFGLAPVAPVMPRVQPTPAPAIPGGRQTNTSPATAGPPRPIMDRARNAWGIARDWAASERGGSTLYGVAAGLQGIENPAMTAVGSFARGFSQAILGSQGLRAAKAATELEAQRYEREQAREDQQLALEQRTADRQEAETLANITNTRLDNDRLEAQLDQDRLEAVQNDLAKYRDDLAGVMTGRGPLGDIEELSPAQRIEYDRLVEAERRRLIQYYGAEPVGGEIAPPAAAGAATPAMSGPEVPWGGHFTSRPTQNAGFSGDGSPQRPYVGWITQEMFNSWPPGTVFYNPADGSLRVK